MTNCLEIDEKHKNIKTVNDLLNVIHYKDRLIGNYFVSGFYLFLSMISLIILVIIIVDRNSPTDVRKLFGIENLPIGILVCFILLALTPWLHGYLVHHLSISKWKKMNFL